MNKSLTILTLLFLIFSNQTFAQKTEWTKEQEDEITGDQKAKFDDDNLVDYFSTTHLNDEDNMLRNVLSINLSSLKSEIKINLLNNSILYNNKKSAYYTFCTINENKICEVVFDYMDQIAIPNISGEKKDLKEKLKFRFNPNNKKVQVIGYELSYKKGSKIVKKSFNFLTGKYIATCKNKGKTTNGSGWAKELQNIYVENWNVTFLRDKIFWYGDEVE